MANILEPVITMSAKDVEWDCLNPHVLFIKGAEMREKNEYTKFDSRYVARYKIEVAKHLGHVWIEDNSLPGSGMLFDMNQWNLIKPMFKDGDIILIPKGECPGYFMQG
jgi:hypothetical protein